MNEMEREVKVIFEILNVSLLLKNTHERTNQRRECLVRDDKDLGLWTINPPYTVTLNNLSFSPHEIEIALKAAICISQCHERPLFYATQGTSAS